MAKGRLRNIIITCVVGAAVVVAIVVPCVLLIPDDSNSGDSGDNGGNSGDDRPTYTFDDYVSSDFGYSSLYPRWDKTDTDNNKFITRNDDGAIVKRLYNKPDNDLEILINGPVENLDDDVKTSAYSVSADNQYVWYRRDWKQVWRHSFTANFAIYRMDGGAGVRLDTAITDYPTNGTIHHMEWSPTGHILAIVYDWDLWVISDLENDTPTLTRVTDDGEKNRIYNGIPDWVYEEEMISANNVLYWAPDSSSFAFLRTDDSDTTIVEFSMYNDAQYPETVQIAYPKAGTNNPTVTLHVYDVTDESIEELVPPEWPTFGPNANFTEFYFSRFTWLDENTCLPTWTDRPQTASVGTKCTRNTTSGGWTCDFVDGATEYVNNGWVGSFGPFNIVWKDMNTHFTIYARESNTDPNDGRWQIAKVDWAGGEKSWLTNTNYDIIGLYFYDADNDWLYYTAAAPLPRQRNVYRVKGIGSSVTDPQCMTCQLNKDYVDRCGWVTPSFNLDRSVAIVNCRGYREPMTVYYTINAAGDWSSKAEVIYDNQELVDKVKGIKWPQKMYGTFKSADYEKEYQYEMYVPADFDDSGNTKYPLLIEVYAGPEFQSITDTWTRGWSSTHMVSDKNIVVASVDGRGSAYEGYKFMREAYLKLGQNEPVDQTAFAKWLAAKPYIDESLVALWGWSYGGYTTSHTIGYDGGETFKCGIAVAPLADWRFYDSMYAERYMARPEDNDDGYTKASIVTGHDLTNFKKAEYTLIHGTADDNVHFQNAAVMEKALVEADVDFDTFFYADQAHSINKGNANRHIYRQLTTRMSHCLGRCDQQYPGGC